MNVAIGHASLWNDRSGMRNDNGGQALCLHHRLGW
jgi:hypothetical protein